MDRRKLLSIGCAGVATACLPALARAQRWLWRIGITAVAAPKAIPDGWMRFAKTIPSAVLLRADRVIE